MSHAHEQYEADIRKAKAAAWDEGYDAGCHDGADDQHGYVMTRTNPYRRES